MRALWIAIAAFVGFGFAAHHRPASHLSDDAAGLILPLPADVLLAGGDSYLAANLNFLRAATTPFDATNSLASRAQFHLRVARLNPKHEDNYYLASGGLVWMGDVNSGQTVLAEAAKARYWDPLPYFFQGANEVYFNRNFLEGGRLVGLAAAIATGGNKTFFTDLSAKLYSRAEDLDAGIRYIKLLAANASSPEFSQFLMKRAQRLALLQQLRTATARYQQQFGQPPQQLEQLVSSGVLTALPQDPIGLGFELDTAGQPILKREKR